MTDGDHYATYASIRSMCMNSALGTSGNQLFDDSAIEEALDNTMAMIHDYLGITTLTKVTNVVQVALLRKIQIDLVAMMILRARHFQTNNLADGGTIMGFWSITPELTREHKMVLDRMVNRNSGVAWNYDTRTGDEVS